ncbi:MAG: hypothetical protein JW384_00551 [Nitrosomonadaceae bacterium]|nr:hypothetical protein [Nitrosomonadaceae bacterium]
MLRLTRRQWRKASALESDAGLLLASGVNLAWLQKPQVSVPRYSMYWPLRERAQRRVGQGK